MSVLDILIKYYPAFLQGLGVTLQMCALIWTSGIVLGVALGVATVRFPALIGMPARLISFLLAGIPTLVFLFWLHYPAQAMMDVVIDPFIRRPLLSRSSIFSAWVKACNMAYKGGKKVGASMISVQDPPLPEIEYALPSAPLPTHAAVRASGVLTAPANVPAGAISASLSTSLVAAFGATSEPRSTRARPTV